MIISEFKFDKLNNINTSDIMNLNEMTTNRISTQYCVEYIPSNVEILKHIFAYLEKSYDFSDSYFLDYGCGKGRAMIYAHQFKFQEIIGVEFANELCIIAKDNIKKLKLENMSIFEEDASIFAIPKHTNVFYFANPFVGDIMEQVIKNINAHKKILNKKILIIYVYPECKEMFIENNYNVVYEYNNEVTVFEK